MIDGFYQDIVILLQILILGFYLILTTRLLVAIIIVSLISILSAFFYLMIGAPDVALTEAAVGAAVSTCILLAALTKYKQPEIIKNSRSERLITLISCFVLFILLCYFAMDLSVYGDINSTANKGVVDYYKNTILKDLGLGSLVTGILASYRGFDTLGETLVIFTSGVAISLILKGSLHAKKNKSKN